MLEGVAVGYIALWALVVVMMALGLVGVIVPALPGTALVFGGFLLGAWIDNFERISMGTVMIAAVLVIIALVTDYVASLLGAKRAGASKLALVGAAIGTVLGIFGGIIGLLLFPLIGAFIGEYLSINDIRKAGNVGIATWLGMLVGAVVKLVLTCFTIGMFIVALLV